MPKNVLSLKAQRSVGKKMIEMSQAGDLVGKSVPALSAQLTEEMGYPVTPSNVRTIADGYDVTLNPNKSDIWDAVQALAEGIITLRNELPTVDPPDPRLIKLAGFELKTGTLFSDSKE